MFFSIFQYNMAHVEYRRRNDLVQRFHFKSFSVGSEEENDPEIDEMPSFS